jgi:hypothetical protein
MRTGGHSIRSGFNNSKQEVSDMKRLVLLLTVLTFVTLASGAVAQQTSATKLAASTPAAPEQSQAARGERFIGKVSSVDVAAKTVAVKNPKAEKTFVVKKTTKITMGGKEMALADLKQGVYVSVSYKMEGEKAMAAAITVSLPKPNPGATPRTTVEGSAETPEE